MQWLDRCRQRINLWMILCKKWEGGNTGTYDSEDEEQENGFKVLDSARGIQNLGSQYLERSRSLKKRRVHHVQTVGFHLIYVITIYL